MKMNFQIRSSIFEDFKADIRMIKVLIKENLKEIVSMVLNFVNRLMVQS